MSTSNFGIVGLAVMGENLARNVESRGYRVSVHNRSSAKVENFIHNFKGSFYGAENTEDFVKSLEAPRKIMLMVKAGKPVDSTIETLIPYLEAGDIIIDGGNSLYKDTVRREAELKEKGIHFMGCGVSGGEEGALNGPSLMPGGSVHAWNETKNVLEAIAAEDFSGGKCVTHVGPDGSGHFVKMVHNGIEYAVMEMMAEGYEILKDLGGMKADEIGDVFEKYNQGELASFLFEIAVPVLKKIDPETGKPLIDLILDEAGQKGTGRWTAIEGLEQGVVSTVISGAVEARVISSQKDLRGNFSKMYPKVKVDVQDQEKIIEALEGALISGMMVAYAQGLELIKAKSEEKGWNIDLAEVVRIWQGGCIIRAELLGFLEKVMKNGNESHMLLLSEIREKMKINLPHLRWIVARGVEGGFPVLSLGLALSTIDGFTRQRTSANFIQGLRDYFGAHTYKRIDKEGVFHTEWNDEQK